MSAKYPFHVNGQLKLSCTAVKLLLQPVMLPSTLQVSSAAFTNLSRCLGMPMKLLLSLPLQISQTPFSGKMLAFATQHGFICRFIISTCLCILTKFPLQVSHVAFAGRSCCLCRLVMLPLYSKESAIANQQTSICRIVMLSLQAVAYASQCCLPLHIHSYLILQDSDQKDAKNTILRFYCNNLNSLTTSDENS